MNYIGRGAYLTICESELNKSGLTENERNKLYNKIFAYIINVPSLNYRGCLSIERETTLKMTENIFREFAKKLGWEFDGEIYNVFYQIVVRTRKLFVVSYKSDSEI